MTDFERAADLIARACPIGFSTEEDNERCCRIIDTLAEEVLALGQPREVVRGTDRGEFTLKEGEGLGLAELLVRQDRIIDSLRIELQHIKFTLDTERMDALFARSEALLSNIEKLKETYASTTGADKDK